MLALIFPQLWQTVSNSFLIFAKKPGKTVLAAHIGTVVPYGLKRTDMENRRSKLNVSKMSRTFLLSFFAGLAVELSIDRSETRIIQTFGARSLSLVVLDSIVST